MKSFLLHVHYRFFRDFTNIFSYSKRKYQLSTQKSPSGETGKRNISKLRKKHTNDVKEIVLLQRPNCLSILPPACSFIPIVVLLNFRGSLCILLRGSHFVNAFQTKIVLSNLKLQKDRRHFQFCTAKKQTPSSP